MSNQYEQQRCEQYIWVNALLGGAKGCQWCSKAMLCISSSNCNRMMHGDTVSSGSWKAEQEDMPGLQHQLSLSTKSGHNSLNIMQQ